MGKRMRELSREDEQYIDEYIRARGKRLDVLDAYILTVIRLLGRDRAAVYFGINESRSHGT